MTRRIFLALLLLGALVATLFAVLTSDDASQYLVFYTWGTATEVESFQRLIGYYNATRKPEHPVRLSHGEQNQYSERLLVQAAARSLPDVIHIDRKDLPLFVHRGLFEDLTARIDSDTGFSLQAFLPELLPGCRSNGRYYGIPHNFSTLVLYYNRDHFDAEGIRYPDSTWTWQTMLRAALRLTKRDSDGKVARYGCLVNIILTTLIEQNGGRVLNQTLDSCVIASPEAEEAVQFAVDLSEKYGVTWSLLAQNLQWDDMFAGGRLSMIANGRWAAAWYMRSMPSGTVNVAPLPRGKLRKGAFVNHMMSISAQSAKKGEAWDFLKFLVSDEAQRMVNTEGANIPARRSVAYSADFLHHRTTPTMDNRVFLEELSRSVPWPFEQGMYVTHYTLQSQLDLAMRRILLKRSTVMQSLSIMEQNVNRTIALQRRTVQSKPFAGSLLFYFCCGLPLAAVALFWIRSRRNHATP